MTDSSKDVYRSRSGPIAERIPAAAVYCSDGRLGEHFDDFLRNGLGLPCYDHVVLPGGPGSLVGHSRAGLEHRGVLDQLQFLIEAHGVERVVLIQHEGCAFYEHRLGVTQEEMPAQQCTDLVAVAAEIRHGSPEVVIEAFMAHLEPDGLRFTPISLG